MRNRLIILSGILLFIIVIVLLRCHSDMSRNEWAKRYGFEKGEVYNIKIRAYGFPYIETIIKNEKVSMMFDTANMTGIQVSAELAKQLKLEKIGELKHYDSAGNIRGSYNVFDSEEIFILGKKIKGEIIYEGVSNDLEGILPPSLLLEKRFTIDYNNKFIGVSKNNFPDIKKEGFPLISNSRYPGMPVVEGIVNGEKVLIQLDTGMSRTCIDENLVRKLNLPANNSGYEINSIKLGSYEFSVTNAKETSYQGISDGYPEPIMLGIGSDIISKIVFTVDYINERVIFSD